MPAGCPALERSQEPGSRFYEVRRAKAAPRGAGLAANGVRQATSRQQSGLHPSTLEHLMKLEKAGQRPRAAGWRGVAAIAVRGFRRCRQPPRRIKQRVQSLPRAAAALWRPPSHLPGTLRRRTPTPLQKPPAYARTGVNHHQSDHRCGRPPPHQKPIESANKRRPRNTRQGEKATQKG